MYCMLICTKYRNSNEIESSNDDKIFPYEHKPIKT